MTEQKATPNSPAETASDTETSREPQGKIPGQMFDEHLTELLRPTLSRMFLEHADVLRSIGVVFDFYGTLNDADIQKGMWLGPHGAVQSADGIVGSLASSLRLTASILDRAFQLEAALREHLTSLLRQIQEAEEKLHGKTAQSPEAEEAAQGADVRPDR